MLARKLLLAALAHSQTTRVDGVHMRGRAVDQPDVRPALGQRRAQDFVRRLDIKTPSIETLVGTLSGGNQQKVQVARWLIADARVLILVDPTRGVDVGAWTEIKRVWSALRADGRAIIIASTDAEELVDVCDRVLVFRRGAIAGELQRADLSEEALLRMATDV